MIVLLIKITLLLALTIFWGYLLTIGLRILLPLDLHSLKTEFFDCFRALLICIASFGAMVTSLICCILLIVSLFVM